MLDEMTAVHRIVEYVARLLGARVSVNIDEARDQPAAIDD